MLIIAALFAVLLSAFGAERLQVCHGDRRCLLESTVGLLPASRFFLARPAPQSEPPTKPTRADAEAAPRPLP